MAPALHPKVTSTLKTQHPSIRSVRYNEACEYCLSCGSDRVVSLWNPETGLLLKNYTGHSQDVLDAVSSSDNACIASAGGDKAVFVHDVITAVIKRRFTEHAGKVNCVRYNSDSSILISGSEDNTIKLWDCRAKANNALQTLTDCKDAITSLDCSEYEILVGSLDKICRIYDVRMAQLISDYIGNEVTCCRFGGDHQMTLVSGLSCPVKLFDRVSGELFNEYKGATSDKYSIECGFAADDKLVVSGSEDGRLVVWNLIDASVVSENRLTHQEGVTSAPITSISSHNKQPTILASCSNRVHVIDLSPLLPLVK